MRFITDKIALLLFIISPGIVIGQSSGAKEGPLFRFGIEAGALPIKFSPDNAFDYGINGYLDLNVSRDSRTWVRLEYGYLRYNTELNYGIRYGSFMLSYNPFKEKEHSIILNGGFGLVYTESIRRIAVSASVQYVYSFNEIFGISAGIKYPITGEFEYMYHSNPYFTIGLQFF